MMPPGWLKRRLAEARRPLWGPTLGRPTKEDVIELYRVYSYEEECLDREVTPSLDDDSRIIMHNYQRELNSRATWALTSYNSSIEPGELVLDVRFEAYQDGEKVRNRPIFSEKPKVRTSFLDLAVEFRQTLDRYRRLEGAELAAGLQEGQVADAFTYWTESGHPRPE